MDSERFDGLVRALGEGTTRRGALGVLAGLAGLGLGEVAAKRRHRGRGKGRVRAQAANPNKVDVCHHDEETGTYHLINIDDSAVQKHLDNHGDFFPAAKNGCCTDTDCGKGEECVIEVDEDGHGAGSCQGIKECENIDTCSVSAICGGGNCTCVPTTEEGSRCHQGQSCNVPACTSSSDCPEGQLCAQTCCSQLICVQQCGAGLQGLGIEAVNADGEWSVPRE